jgi:hypothetical protein
MRPAPDPDRTTLEQHWLELTCERLPRVARARGWPVTADHCFQRILLDHATGGVWYDHVPGRSAFRHIAQAQLAEAVRLGEAVLAGTVDLAKLNRASLAWRRDARASQGHGPLFASARTE